MEFLDNNRNNFKNVLWNWFVLWGLVLVFPFSSKAQVTEQLWMEYRPSYHFEHQWKLDMRASYRTDFEDPRWHTIETRFMPVKKINKYFDAVGSLQLMQTAQSGEFTTFEIRPALGFKVHFTPDSRIETSLFPRAEYRFVLNEATNTWNNSPRIRLRGIAQMPFNSKTMKGDKIWYGVLDAEAFFIEDTDIQETYANRIWLRYTMGYKLNSKYKFELMYNFQESKNTIATDEITNSGIIRLIFRHNLN